LDVIGSGLLEEHGLPAKDLLNLLKVVDTAMKHEIWQRMEKANEKYFEVPFSAIEKDAVVRGVIDMIFKEQDGWVIIDYKTDDFDKVPERKAVYEKQLEAYGKFWEKIAGEKVKGRVQLRV